MRLRGAGAGFSQSKTGRVVGVMRGHWKDGKDFASANDATLADAINRLKAAVAITGG